MDYITKELPAPGYLQDEDIVFLNADGYPLTHDTVEKLEQQDLIVKKWINEGVPE